MIYGGIEKRDMLCSLLKDVATFMDSDCMYSVTDTEKFIAYIPGKKVDIQANLGDLVPEQSPLMAAFRERRIITKIVPKEVWGTAFRSTATPIIDVDGKVIGCVGIGMSIDQETKLINTYQNFAELLGNMTNLNEEINSGIEHVHQTNGGFVEQMKDVSSDVLKANDFIGQINSLSQTTDMLSMNASVEAVHAGEHGRGFAIVATEIKKLSSKTKELSNDIGAILNNINESFNSLSQLSSENTKEIAQQLEALKENQKVVNEMHQTASEYSKLLKL